MRHPLCSPPTAQGRGAHPGLRAISYSRSDPTTSSRSPRWCPASMRIGRRPHLLDEEGGAIGRGKLRPARLRSRAATGGPTKIRFHDLRHSFASLLIAQGEQPKLISEQLGHASVQITLDRYALVARGPTTAGDRLEAPSSAPSCKGSGRGRGTALPKTRHGAPETIVHRSTDPSATPEMLLRPSREEQCR